MIENHEEALEQRRENPLANVVRGDADGDPTQ